MTKKIGNKYSPVWAFPENEFIDIVKNSFSFNSIVKKIGLNNGGFCNTVRNRINKLGLNISHFNKKKGYEDWKKKKKWSLEDILIENSKYKGSGKDNFWGDEYDYTIDEDAFFINFSILFRINDMF